MTIGRTRDRLATIRIWLVLAGLILFSMLHKFDPGQSLEELLSMASLCSFTMALALYLASPVLAWLESRNGLMEAKADVKLGPNHSR